MTSRFALLVSVGILGVGCSGGDEGGNGGPPAPPSTIPNFATMPQPAAMQTTNPLQTGGAATPGPANTETPPPVTAPPNTGAMAGAAGATGMTPPGGTEIPTGTGLALTPTAGFVAGTTNEVGIQGYFYTFNDNGEGGNTTIEPADFADAMGSTICASGIAAQVVDGPDGTPAYGTYWGGGIGLNLADPGNMTGAQPWARGRVVGFSFNVTGTQIPPAGQLRFKVKVPNDNTDYCVNAAPGANSFNFSQVVAECYNGPTAGGPAPAAAPLEAIQWQVATVTAAATPFNFCVENLTAIVQ